MSDGIYFIIQGECRVLNKNNKPIRVFRQYSYFGDNFVDN
jgi:hypothetical protein